MCPMELALPINRVDEECNICSTKLIVAGFGVEGLEPGNNANLGGSPRA